MIHKFTLAATLVTTFLFTSCSKLPFDLPFLGGEKSGGGKASSHQKFISSEEYPKTYEIFKDEELLSIATTANSKILVDLSDQRTQFLVNGQVALDSPCCTGRAGKRTPTGNFRIKEKIKNKRSTIFGSLYRGNTKVYGGDRRKYKGSYTKFVGSPLPYWMRVTGDGIGFHYSANVKRYPASAGCIRMPMEGVTAIYSKISRGAKVTIQP